MLSKLHEFLERRSRRTDGRGWVTLFPSRTCGERRSRRTDGRGHTPCHLGFLERRSRGTGDVAGVFRFQIRSLPGGMGCF